MIEIKLISTDENRLEHRIQLLTLDQDVPPIWKRAQGREISA